MNLFIYFRAHTGNEPQNDMVIKRAIFYASIPQKDIWVLRFNLLLLDKYYKNDHQKWHLIILTISFLGYIISNSIQ